MSISNLLTNEENRNEFVSSSGEGLRTVLGLGGLAAVLGASMSSKSRGAYKAPKDGKTTKLGQAGQLLKKSVDTSFDTRASNSLRSANDFFEDLISESSKILKKTVENSLEDLPEEKFARDKLAGAIKNEKTYLLTAVRDAIRDLGLAGEAGASDLLLGKIDDILENEMRNADSLSEQVEDVLRTLRNNTPNDKKIEQYKRFKALKDNQRFFSGRAKAMNVAEGFIRNKDNVSNFADAFKQAIMLGEGVGEDKIDSVLKKRNSQFSYLENQLKDFRSKLASSGGAVDSFQVIKEHDGSMASIYMNIKGRQKELGFKPALHLSNVNNSRKIVRLTNSLNTPSNISSFMIDMNDVNKIFSGQTNAKDVETILRRSTPEKYMQKTFLKYLEANSLMVDDLSERETNKLLEQYRAQTISVNRGSLYPKTSTPLGDELAKNLAFQQSLNSSQAIIYGYEGGKREAQNIPIKLMGMYPEIFDAPGAASTVIREGNLKGLGVQYGINVNVRKLGEEILPTTLNALKGFGYKNRSTTPLTSREYQFFGRPDLLSGIVTDEGRIYNQGLVGSNRFGKGGKISIMGSNSSLLSIDEGLVKTLENKEKVKHAGLGQIKGANFAGITFFGQGQGALAGLGEGQAYYGGTMEVEIPLQKSVLDPDTMKRPEFAFLRNLIDKRKAGEGKRAFKIKADEVAKIFGMYSNEMGEIPLGEIDNRIVGLKRYAGLTEMHIEIDPFEGVGEDKGRVKYNLTGKARIQSDINKLFGILGRITSIGGRISEEQTLQAIKQSFGSEFSSSEGSILAQKIMQTYKSDFGGKMANLIVGDASGISKGVDYLQNYMYGGYRMLGGTDEALKKVMTEGEAAKQEVLNLSRSIEGSGFLGTEEQLQRAKLIDFAKKLAQGLTESGEAPSSTALTAMLAPIKYLEEDKFNLKKGDLEKYVTEPLGITLDEDVLKSSIAIGGGSSFAGSSEQILGRNMAKFEPRHANILMYGMRTFFGLNTEQSVKYLNDFIIRQQGIEYSGKYLPDIVSMGLGMRSNMRQSVDAKPFSEMTPEQFKSLALDAQTNTKLSPTNSDKFRRNLISAIDYDNPTALRIADVVKNKRSLDLLANVIPSGQVIIPSGRTIEGMINYQIPKGDTVENIDARLIGNLKGLFENLYEIDADLKPTRRANAISTLVEDTIDASSLALRKSLSGSVMGSISSQGGALMLNPKNKSVTLPEADLANARRVYAKQQGYSVFTRTGRFIDSLGSFMGGATKSNVIKDATDAITEKNARDKMISKFKSFMFEHLDPEAGMIPARGPLLRNPSMSITHMLPGMALNRFDVSEKYQIGNMLDDDVKESISKLRAEVGMKGDIASMTPEDVYRLEKKVLGDEKVMQSVSKQTFDTNIESFKKGMNSFFGTNIPKNMIQDPKTLEDIETNLKQLKDVKTKSTSNTVGEMEGSLRKARASLRNPEKATKGVFNTAYLNIIQKFHNEYGVGGGEILIPQFEGDVKIKGRDKVMSSRLDLAYSLIGDFDADIYQFFHETKNISNKVFAERGEEVISNITRASAKFGIIRNLIDESYKTLGNKLNSDGMMFNKFIADQAKKEVILKNVGGVDVQFKSVLLGMVENSLQATPEDLAGIRSSAAILEQISHSLVTGGVYQDTSSLKAKKLPFAVELGNIIGGAIRTGLESGDVTEFEDVFTRLILNNSPELLEGFEIEDIDLRGTMGDVEDMYKKNLVGQKISGRQLMEHFSEGIRTAHRQGFGYMGSENKLSKPMKALGGKVKGLFETVLMRRNALEMGLLGAPSNFKDGGTAQDKMGLVLDEMTTSMSSAKSNVMKKFGGKGMAGLIGMGLVSSYALGATHSTSALSGPDKFSDAKVKNEIGQRAIYNSMNRQHRDISPQSMQAPHNLYEREIMQKQMYVNKPSSIAITGNASNINDAQQILQSISAMGGRGHLSIQDNVMPRPNIADYYMRDY